MNTVEQIIKEVEKRPYLWNTKLRDKSFDADSQWNVIGETVGLPGNLVKAKWRNLRDSYRKTLRKKIETAEPVEQWEEGWNNFRSMKFLLETLIQEIMSGCNARKNLKLPSNFSPSSLSHLFRTIDDGILSTYVNGNQNNVCIKKESSDDETYELEPGEIILPKRKLNEDRTFNKRIAVDVNVSTNDSNESSSNIETNDDFHDDDRSSDEENEEDSDFYFFKSLLPFVKEVDVSRRESIRREFSQLLSEMLFSGKVGKNRTSVKANARNGAG